MARDTDVLEQAADGRPPSGIERRGSPRRKTRFKATVVHGADYQTAPCLVVEISETGARIRSEIVGSLPDAFYVVWHAERSALAVDLIWRSGVEMGVRFKSKTSFEGKMTAELAAVYRAWGQ